MRRRPGPPGTPLPARRPNPPSEPLRSAAGRRCRWSASRAGIQPRYSTTIRRQKSREFMPSQSEPFAVPPSAISISIRRPVHRSLRMHRSRAAAPVTAIRTSSNTTARPAWPVATTRSRGVRRSSTGVRPGPGSPAPVRRRRARGSPGAGRSTRRCTGCIVVPMRGAPDGRQGHVGLYLRHEGDTVVLFGGNPLDAVREPACDASRLSGCPAAAGGPRRRCVRARERRAPGIA